MVKPGRLIAIGDIHGHIDALEALLSLLSPKVNDHFVFLGDYIDHGPDSYAVINKLISFQNKFKSTFILGNHEEMLLSTMKESEYLSNWLSYGGSETLSSYERRGFDLSTLPSDHLKFLTGCVPYYKKDSYLFAHATLSSSFLRKNSSDDLRWKFFGSQKRLTGKTVVVGHTPQKDGVPLDKGYAVCVDTNIAQGGSLTAFDVMRRRYWQVDSSGHILSVDQGSSHDETA